jgi:hypothetical protein
MSGMTSPDEQTDEPEPEKPGWLAALVHVNSRPSYPERLGEVPLDTRHVTQYTLGCDSDIRGQTDGGTLRDGEVTAIPARCSAPGIAEAGATERRHGTAGPQVSAQ